jgi:hypothetical protein
LGRGESPKRQYNEEKKDKKNLEKTDLILKYMSFKSLQTKPAFHGGFARKTERETKKNLNADDRSTPP